MLEAIVIHAAAGVNAVDVQYEQFGSQIVLVPSLNHHLCVEL